MSAYTVLAVLTVAACLLSASARPPGEGWDLEREDIRLTLTPGSQTLYASWNVTLSNVTVTWKDQYDVGDKMVLDLASGALITDLRPATKVTVSVYAHSIENPPTAVEIIRTLEQEIQLTLVAGSKSILAQWGDAFPLVALTWKDESGPRGNQIVDYRSDARILNLEPCTFVTVSIQTENSGKPLFAAETIRTLTNAPSTVSRLRSLSTTAQNVSLAWKRPDTKCPITAYIITYYEVAKSGHRNRYPNTEIISHGVATNYTVDCLHPDTDYTMEVAARNEAGLGQRESIHVSTQEGVPSRPSKLDSFSDSSNSITLTWKKPEEPNGVLRNYSVGWYEDGKKVGETAVPYLTHTIVGLSPCVEYRVRVAATTGAGKGAYEEVTQATAGAPPSVHSAICTIAPDEQEVTIKWSKPESACLITDYELSWQNDTEQSFASINAFTAGPSPSCTATMPSEKHSTICVAAMLNEERGQRTCCLNNPHPKDSGWLLTSLLFVVLLVTVVGAALLRRKLIAKCQPQFQNSRAIMSNAPNELANSSQNTNWWNNLPCMKL